MTQELTLYRFFWFRPGQDIDRASHFEEFDGSPTQDPTLALCVFPGVLRELKRDNGEVVQIVVTKAKVELK
jgi:hypothetical protein